jgi:hypothetical protein
MSNESRVPMHLEAAIQTMRDACDDAARYALWCDGKGDAAAIRHVLHKLSWGFANASTSIEAAMATVEREQTMSLAAQRTSTAAPFVVKHYESDERPTIKGNGFDGLEVGETREEAQEFVDFVNAHLSASRK